MTMQQIENPPSPRPLCPCKRSGLLLAERLDQAVAIIDVQANILEATPRANSLLSSSPALLTSKRRIGILSSAQSRKFHVAIRKVLANGQSQMIRADDGCEAAPMILQMSIWLCPSHCLVSFHEFEPKPVACDTLEELFDLTPRQSDLLGKFATGQSLPEIAAQSDLKPQTVREAFSNIYSKLQVRNQLELMAVLASIGVHQLASPV